MINKTQKKALLKSLGKKHVAKIKIYASEVGFTKANGKEYSRSTFSAVFNNDLDLPEVEKIIFDAATHYYSLAEKEKEERKLFVTKVNTNS